ncbi:serine hydrolase domain-containing protein [Streptomyces halobius]|uniref:Beta-lactamase family protein n=1 Tax=Streptomyces halobius TaxID=2879846 RepID=A0ABY4MAL4_9ACTN|nr:serine hydrolase domain-containing protein [Streptomyces halobius]UQA94183.1 beta-lactamase family protein [Streptomyces halobius]
MPSGSPNPLRPHPHPELLTKRRRARLAGAATAVLLALAVPAATAAPAWAASEVAGPVAVATNHRTGLDRPALDGTLRAFHDAGMYGAYSAVRDGAEEWRGAAGVADITTGRPTTPDMRHRIGSITKSFTAVAVLQQAGAGRVELDAPIGRYLPALVPGERGRAITVRMLLNHTSGIGEYTHEIFAAPDSLETNRFRQFDPRELARLGLKAKPLGKPGQAHHYANTNYVIAGLLLRKITGESPEKYITDHVIRKAGLRHTYFPRSPHITGPHAKGYEAAFGAYDPPRDFSVYNMSWAGTAGSLISTTADLNQFYRSLLRGELLAPAQLREMKKTVPVEGDSTVRYGLGLLSMKLPYGEFWGHNGKVPGSMTWSLSSTDGKRQLSLGFNLTNYQELDDNNLPIPGRIDTAMKAHLIQALCGKENGASKVGLRPGGTSSDVPLWPEAAGARDQ